MIVASLIILAPLAAAMLVIAVRRCSVPLALTGAGISFAAAAATLARIVGGERYTAELPGLPSLPLRLVVAPTPAVLAVTVATVNLLIVIYAAGYMQGESDQARFFAEMSLFTGAMQTLVLAGDWVLFLTAWEVVGFASYLLIGFWFDRSGVPQAATRAFLVTRGADIGLYIGAIILIVESGTSRIDGAGGLSENIRLAASLCLLVAAMGKAAQVPFQGWLQDAMVGPTPVSALLHSTTLVVAGAILLIRAGPLLPGDALLVIGVIGGVTAIVTGLTAIAEPDFKRMLASSTSSQLGFMFLAIGAGFPGAALFHMVTNAAIKSSLFLSAGVVQHARQSTRFTNLRGVGRDFRWIGAALTAAGLALAGIPPLAGFWSKDAIIAATIQADRNWLLVPLIMLGTVLTGLYVGRSLRLLLQANGHAQQNEDVPGLIWMGTGLVGLTALAVLAGLSERWLSEHLAVELPEGTRALVLGVAAALAGLAVGWLQPAASWLGSVKSMAASGFRIGDGFTGLVVRPSLALARVTDRLDHAIHDFVLGAGGGGVGVGARVVEIDGQLHALIQDVGGLGLTLSALARRLDEDGIDTLLGGLVQQARALGSQARKVQTGRIHREMLLAAGGAAVLVVVLLVS